MTENSPGNAQSRRGLGLFSSYEGDFAPACAIVTLVLVTLGQIFPMEGTRRKVRSCFPRR